MFPARVGTRWVDTVALVAARLEPPGAWPWIGWGVVAVALARLLVGAFAGGGGSGKNRDPDDHASPDR
jgi:hypothetical protein